MNFKNAYRCGSCEDTYEHDVDPSTQTTLFEHPVCPDCYEEIEYERIKGTSEEMAQGDSAGLGPER